MTVRHARYGRRTPRQQRQHLRQVQPGFAEGEGEGGLEAEHPRGSLVEGKFLHVWSVRGVVRGDRVDRPIGQAFADRPYVDIGPQWRMDLEHRVV